MPDPFSFFTDPSQAALGIAPPAPTPTPKPAAPAPAPRSAAATMLAPQAPAANPNRPMVYSPQYGTVVFKDTGLPATDAEVRASLSTPKELAKGAPTREEAEAASKPADTMGVYLQGLRRRESGGNDSAVNPTTHATGRYQFLPSTWASLARAHPELGLQPQDIYNPEKQEQAIRAFTNDNIQILTLNKLPVEPGSLYAMHFLGSGAGPQFLKAVASNPNGDASAMFPAAARANPSVFYAKEGRPRSLSQVYAQMAQSFGGQMASADPGEAQAVASFDKAAGAPTAPRGFVEERAVTEDASALPPPLPGMKLDDASTPLPPPLPGMKLDYNAKDPLTSANPYAGEEKPKPEGPALEIAGVDSNGEPIFADPKAQKEYFDARAATGEAAAAGVASNLTGLGEWDFTDPVNAPAQLSKQLQESGKKDPLAYKIGEWAPAAIPAGEVFSGAKEVAAGGKALRGLWESGSKSGLAAGAITSATTATGETDTAKRLNEKAEDVFHGGIAGAAGGSAVSTVLGGLSAAGSGIASGARWLGGEAGFLLKALPGEAKKAVEELITGFKAETGQALSADERKIAEVKVADAVEKAKLAQHEDELKKITDAQAQLAERERVRAEQGRDARQIDDPKAAEELRAGVTARARERAQQAEAQAKEAGASAEQAKAYAVEQEQKVLDAKTAAQEIAAEFTKNPSEMTKERFGEIVQKAASDMQDKAEEAREVAADFKGAMASAPPGPVVKNDGVMKVLDDIDASSADRSVHAITDEIRKQFVTRQRNAEGAWEVVDKNGITVERADSLRKVLNTAMRSRNMAIEGGSADASAARHHIGKVLEALEDATGEAHPAYNAAVKAWRDNSRGPLDEFLPKQALGKITKTEDFSGRFAMNEGRVVNEILSQSNSGSEALVKLARSDPAVRQATEEYLDREFQRSMGGKPTIQKVKNYVDKNQATLEKLGLTDKYSAKLRELESAGKDVESAAATAKTAKDAATKAEAQRKALEKVADERRSLLERSKKEQPGDVFALGVEKPKVDPTKDAAEKAKSDAARLKEKAAGPAAAKAETERNIDAIAKERGKAETARKAYADFQSRIDNAEKAGTLTNDRAISEAKSLLSTLRERDIIDDAKYKELDAKIQVAAKATSEHKTARSFALKIGAILASGVVGGEYIAHRIYLK